jgi:hypothetical protein
LSQKVAISYSDTWGRIYRYMAAFKIHRKGTVASD